MQTFAIIKNHFILIHAYIYYIYIVILQSIMRKLPQITMKDIARELGVSVATVSRALNNSPNISKNRREEIQQYARERNFSPNILAGNLRLSKVKPIKVIGVIVPEIVHFFFSTVVSGIEEEASQRGYRIIVAQSRENFEREVQICEDFVFNRLCGIIVSQAKETHNYDHFKKIQDMDIPLVFFDRICTGINASLVVIDDYHGAFTATSHLIKTGCKRIAFCGGPMNLEIVKNRLNGYKDALLQHGLKVDKDLIIDCDNHSQATAIIPQMMSMKNPPDAFFSINDDTAVGVCHTVKRLGYRVPEDISICGFTNGEKAQDCEPMLTTIDQQGYEIGRQAADILIKKVEGITPIDKVEKRIVRTSLIIRETTRTVTS